MFKRIIFVAAIVLWTIAVSAKVRLPQVLSDGMVIQQQTEVRFWGYANPRTAVKVSPSWQREKQVVRSDAQGYWEVFVRSPRASFSPLSIGFSDGEEVWIKNILSGEVWLCGGQSNMEMPVRGFDDCPVEGYADAVATAGRYSDIRYVKIPARMSSHPLDDAPCAWQQITPSTVGDCSAVGYAFAQVLSNALHVPIGLVLANKGGSSIESWLTEDELRQYTNEPTDSAAIAARYPTDWMRPMLWGNGTFAPIRRYTIGGIIYYQGCSNVGFNTAQYAERLALLIDRWRKDFRSETLPFLYVQIAPYNYGDAGGTAAAELREQQFAALRLISHSSLVCTNDLVYPWEAEQIHPAQKRIVGQRLALAALGRHYKQAGVMFESASARSLEVRGDTCIVHLDNTYRALFSAGDIQGFEIAGTDGVFYPAKAHIVGNDALSVRSDQVMKPMEVCYCFRNFLIGSVRNRAGLPLFPFRIRLEK